ncbi:MAG: hypothetical protein WDZ38_04105 [Balneolaceae bacterium]
MKIISDFIKDTQSAKMNPGGYEWWYFDAMSKNGYSIVVIFYCGNPFSRRYINALRDDINNNAEQFPAISVSVYKDSKPVYYSFEETKPEQAEFSKVEPKGRVRDSRFKGSRNDGNIFFTIQLDQKLINGDSIFGELHFSSNDNSLSEIVRDGSDDQEKHIWNLVMPKCKVKGKLTLKGYQEEEILFDGVGYHDHNSGNEPMKESFRQWYWGRYHTENATFIYYLMEGIAGWDEKAWLIEDGGTIKRMNQPVKKEQNSFSLFALKNARTLSFESGHDKIFLQLDKCTDNGPFYLRYQGNLIIKSGDQIETATGISEYIFPSRINNRVFWPLVNMRISYPGEQHWVQKSPVLYRWTW